MKKRKKPEKFVDDGRVIANMNIDGMPHSVFRRDSIDRMGKGKEKEEPVKIPKKERRSIILGMLSSYALFGIIVFGAFALFILFCVKVWFK